MVKNPLVKYESITNMLVKLKAKNNSDEVNIEDLRKEIALNFNIIDHIAVKRFMVSLDKLGLIKPSALANKVKICS
jgi:hypothetical protein